MPISLKPKLGYFLKYLIYLVNFFYRVLYYHFIREATRCFSGQLGDLGSGAGQGGGGGGSIREAGGAFGKMEAAREEEYFYKKVLLFVLNRPYFIFFSSIHLVQFCTLLY